MAALAPACAHLGMRCLGSDMEEQEDIPSAAAADTLVSGYVLETIVLVVGSV